MRLIIHVGLGVDRPEDYAALKAYLFANFSQPPTELVVADPEKVSVLANQLSTEFDIPVTRFQVQWADGSGITGHGAAKITYGDMAVYASEVPGSAAIVVVPKPRDLALHLRTVCGTYGLACHLVRVSATRFDRGDVPAEAKDVTPQLVATPQPVDAEPYIFPQSHSSLGVFETCPRQYEAKYITKECPYVQSAEAKWGDDVHQVLENYLKAAGQYVVPSNMAMYQPFADWVLNRAAASGGKVFAERNMAVNKELHPVPYKDRGRWMGGKIDVTIIYPDRRAEVFDWKTGKMKNDQTQLQMYGALTLANHPDIDSVAAGYVWLKDQAISPPVYYQRQDFALHWDTFKHKYARLREAYVHGVFPPKPNGLCKKWCDVKRCEFHGEGRR